MIVGAGEEHRIGIKMAKSMGYATFVIDGNPNAPGFQDADDHAVVSTYDYKKALDIVNGVGIDGVMTLASDVPYTVAYVAHHLGLKGIPLESAMMLSDKLAMKDAMHKWGVPMPLYERVGVPEQIWDMLIQVGCVVVKPVDSRGARGVQRLTKGMDWERAYYVAENYSPSSSVMMEQYLAGPQLSVEGFMIGGKAYLPAIFDRNYPYLNRYAPFMVEDGGEMPSTYSNVFKEECERVMALAARSVGLEEGIIKGDLVIHEGLVKVIEIAGRMSGGWFATVATPHSTGVNMVKNLINWSLGSPPKPEDWQPTEEKFAAIRFAFPRPGVVIKAEHLDSVQKDKTCLYARLFVKKGERITAIRAHPDRPAVVVASGESLFAAVSNAERLIRILRIETNGEN